MWSLSPFSRSLPPHQGPRGPLECCYPPTDQQLGVLLPKANATGSMTCSPHWPGASSRLPQFTPVLQGGEQDIGSCQLMRDTPIRSTHLCKIACIKQYTLGLQLWGNCNLCQITPVEYPFNWTANRWYQLQHNVPYSDILCAVDNGRHCPILFSLCNTNMRSCGYSSLIPRPCGKIWVPGNKVSSYCWLWRVPKFYAVGDHTESCAHSNTQSIGWGCGIREVHGFGQLHPYVCNGRMWEISSMKQKLLYLWSGYKCE